MKTVVVALVGVFILAVIGVAIFALVIITNGPINLPGMPVSVATTPEEITGMLSSGQSIKCTFDSVDKDDKQTWVTYIDGEKMRADSVELDGSEAAEDGHLINDGDYAYMWALVDGKTAGTKYKLAETDKASINSSVHERLNHELGEDIVSTDEANARCERWTPDASVFVPPSDVEFVDLNAQINTITNLNSEGGAFDNVCGMCANAGDAEAQASCRQALSC